VQVEAYDAALYGGSIEGRFKPSRPNEPLPLTKESLAVGIGRYRSIPNVTHP